MSTINTSLPIKLYIYKKRCYDIQPIHSVLTYGIVGSLGGIFLGSLHAFISRLSILQSPVLSKAVICAILIYGFVGSIIGLNKKNRECSDYYINSTKSNK